MSSRRGLALASVIVLVATVAEGVARAQRFPDPRAFGFVAGRGATVVGFVAGLAGIAAAVWLAGIRRFHARRWLRRWFLALGLTLPLLLIAAPLLAGAVASRYLAGDPVGDQVMVASARFFSLAAATGWLIYEIMAAVRQHEHDLYAEQRPQDRAARTMRAIAASLAVLLVGALIYGVSVTVIPKL